MLNIIICEDEKKQRQLLEERIRQLNLLSTHTVYSFEDAEEMIHFCSRLKGDFIFLMDIVLKNSANGIDVVRRINTVFPQSIIIYISAYLDKVTDIFDTHHCYFIYKPELDQHLEKAMKKAVGQVIDKKQVLTVQSGGKHIVIPVEDILWIERIKRYSLIQTRTEIYRIPEDFSALLERLPGYFKQCHRCFVVNFGAVKKHTKTEFIMKNDQWIPISRGYSKQICEEFQQYISAVF